MLVTRPLGPLVVFAMFVVVAATAAAQVASGQLTGRVTDSAGGAIAGAIVTAMAVDSGATRTTVSSDAGVYSLPALSPGRYRIEVERSGSRTIRRVGVT